jgi:hypothetical protein
MILCQGLAGPPLLLDCPDDFVALPLDVLGAWNVR